MARFEAFWDVMCDYMQYLWLGVMLMIFLFVLALFSLYFARPGTGSFAIAIVDTILIVTIGSVLSGMFWVCDQRKKQAY
jgi:hypothetical protein